MRLAVGEFPGEGCESMSYASVLNWSIAGTGRHRVGTMPPGVDDRVRLGEARRDAVDRDLDSGKGRRRTGSRRGGREVAGHGVEPLLVAAAAARGTQEARVRDVAGQGHFAGGGGRPCRRSTRERYPVLSLPSGTTWSAVVAAGCFLSAM